MDHAQRVILEWTHSELVDAGLARDWADLAGLGVTAADLAALRVTDETRRSDGLEFVRYVAPGGVAHDGRVRSDAKNDEEMPRAGELPGRSVREAPQAEAAGPAYREVWWNADWALPLRATEAGGERSQHVVAVQLEIDAALLWDPTVRFPSYRVVDRADWLEEGHLTRSNTRGGATR